MITDATLGKYCQRCVTLSHQIGINTDYRKKIAVALLGNKNGAGGRIYHLDETRFDEIQDESQAYWLGFLMADGCVRSDGTIHIKLASKDYDHLNKFREFIKTNYLIKETTNNGRYYKHIVMRSQHMVDSLMTLGVVPRKSPITKIPPPELLQESLVRHFIRGVFDGDGWVTYNWKVGLVFGIIGSYTLMSQIQEVLIRNCGLNHTKLHRDKQQASNTYVSLVYGGNKQTRRIYRYLYANANIYLPRKELIWHSISL